jgi:hypothetical protein
MSSCPKSSVPVMQETKNNATKMIRTAFLMGWSPLFSFFRSAPV